VDRFGLILLVRVHVADLPGRADAQRIPGTVNHGSLPQLDLVGADAD
jgi:hypothetical protein